MTDPHHLQRFVDAQSGSYQTALTEIRAGKKRSHWMWYIFPQIAGLGHSDYAICYAIRDRSEAEAYLQHPILGARLVAISNALLQLPTTDAFAFFGSPDHMKLHSSMTLFASLPGDHQQVFEAVLDKYYGGKMDARTTALLKGR
jgi:uncharacterized protein (DUF1810 family)